MITKTEVDMVIAILKSVITMVETVDPEAQQNKFLIEVNNAISLLQKIGL